MTAVGTEGLPIFDLSRAPKTPEGELSLSVSVGGIYLRDKALAKHQKNHAADIAKVRVALLVACQMRGLTEVTADDASVIADQLGIPGDRRWLGACFRGWERVRVTDRTIPSRLSRRHSRRVAVWQVL